MAVTEIAILHSTSGSLTQELREGFKGSKLVQEEWIAQTFPDSPSAALVTKNAFYEQVEDPAKILLMASWDSVAQHWQWIQGDANQQLMGSLTGKIELEGENKFVLFHLDTDSFGTPAPAGLTNFLDSPVLSVSRMFIESENKEAFQRELDSGLRALEEFAKPHAVGGGWRVDKEADTKEEYVLLVGWDSVDRHTAFGQSPNFSKLAATRQFLTGADIKHYKRFM